MPGKWWVLAAAVLWGTTGTAQAFAPDAAQSEVVGAVRLIIGGLTLLMWAVGRGVLTFRKPWAWSAMAFGAVGVALYQLSFFVAVDRTGVAVGTIVAIGSAPIWGGILGFLVRGEKLDWRWGAATALAILGCTLLVASGGSLDIDPLGVVLALIAGGSYALYAVASKRLLDDHPPDAVMAVIFCAGAVLLSPILLFFDLKWLTELRGIAVVLHLGIITTALSYVFFARGLLTTSVATTTTLSLAEPLTAGILGVVVLGEKMTLPALIGIALLISGLVLLSVGSGAPDEKLMNSSGV